MTSYTLFDAASEHRNSGQCATDLRTTNPQRYKGRNRRKRRSVVPSLRRVGGARGGGGRCKLRSGSGGGAIAGELETEARERTYIVGLGFRGYIDRALELVFLGPSRGICYVGFCTHNVV
jgi:hypothetical protein